MMHLDMNAAISRGRYMHQCYDVHADWKAGKVSVCLETFDVQCRCRVKQLSSRASCIILGR